MSHQATCRLYTKCFGVDLTFHMQRLPFAEPSAICEPSDKMQQYNTWLDVRLTFQMNRLPFAEPAAISEPSDKMQAVQHMA